MMSNYHSDLYIPCQFTEKQIGFMQLPNQTKLTAIANFNEVRNFVHTLYDELYAEKKYDDLIIAHEDVIDTVMGTDRWGWNRASGLWLKRDETLDLYDPRIAVVENINDSDIFKFVFSKRSALRKIVRWCNLQIDSIEEMQLEKRRMLTTQLGILHLSDAGNGHWEITRITYADMSEHVRTRDEDTKQTTQFTDINGMSSMFPLDGPPFL